jgi:hypothetical protein
MRRCRRWDCGVPAASGRREGSTCTCGGGTGGAVRVGAHLALTGGLDDASLHQEGSAQAAHRRRTHALCALSRETELLMVGPPPSPCRGGVCCGGQVAPTVASMLLIMSIGERGVCTHSRPTRGSVSVCVPGQVAAIALPERSARWLEKWKSVDTRLGTCHPP